MELVTSQGVRVLNLWPQEGIRKRMGAPQRRLVAVTHAKHYCLALHYCSVLGCRTCDHECQHPGLRTFKPGTQC